jgi:hypothetical protein
LAEPSEAVDAAPDAEWTTVEDVRAHHRRAHLSVAQQLLHGADVIAIFQEMSRKWVPERVRPHTLRAAGLLRRLGDDLLHNGFVEVKASRWPISDPCRREREHELPPHSVAAFVCLRSSANGSTTRAPTCARATAGTPSLQRRRKRLGGRRGEAPR